MLRDVLKGRDVVYRGRPLSVLRVIDGEDRLHPTPNGPFPLPESYDKEICGVNPDLAGLRGTAIERDPVPVRALVENFSPMPRMAPPPFGSEICGGANGEPAESDFS